MKSKTAKSKPQTKPQKKVNRIREEFPPIRMVQRRNGTMVYRVDCRSNGWVGQSTYEFSTRKDALDKARSIAEAVDNRGAEAVSAAIAFNQEGELAVFTQKLAGYGKSLKDAAVHYLSHLEDQRSRDKSLQMPELLRQWNTFKQDPSQQLRPRSKQSIQWWSTRFSADFCQHRVTDVTYEVLRHHYDHLVDTDKKPASQRYRKQFIGYLGQFFNWCIQRGHCVTNPTVRIKVRSVVPDAEFLSLDQCRRLVEVLNQPEFKPVRTSVVAGLFAGVRQAELERLTWADVNMDQNTIGVSQSKSKIRRGRSVPIEPVLRAWLSNCDTTTTTLSNPPRRLMERFRKQLGFKLPQNVLRHTYATYWQSRNKNYSTLADNLGNTEEVASRHYVRMVSKADAEQFWSLYPYSETATHFFNFTQQNEETGESGLV
jgi:integrase